MGPPCFSPHLEEFCVLCLQRPPKDILKACRRRDVGTAQQRFPLALDGVPPTWPLWNEVVSAHAIEVTGNKKIHLSQPFALVVKAYW